MSQQKIFKSPHKSKTYPEITVQDYVLNKLKEQDGDKIALIDNDSKFSITYKQLIQYTEVYSQNLAHTYGAKKGDVLAILSANHPLFSVTLYGTLKSGVTLTTLNPLYTDAEIQKQLIDSKAKWIVTIPHVLETVKKAIEKTDVKIIFIMSSEKVEEKEENGVKILSYSNLLKPPQEFKELEIKYNPKEDVCLLPYSSGTTGLSKGVMLTHYNFVSNMVQGDIEKAIVDHGETLIGVLPMFHIYALYAILGVALTRGCKVVTMARFDLVKFLTIIQEEKVKRLHIVPPLVLALAKQPIVEKFDLSSVKQIVSAAAPLSGDLVIECEKRLGLKCKQAFGMTESSPLVCAQLDGEEVIGGSGTLIPDEELRIVDPETGKDLDIDQEGELVIRGPNIMKGYLNNEEATKFTIRDGWLFTGDIGKIDKNGQIYIVDRVKELIKYKGYQVPPAELEAILLTHPAVADVCVIGVPDIEAGEIPKAFIVLKKDCKHDYEEFIDYVEKKVSPQKKIRLVEFIDQIPKSLSGKILRRVLRDKEREKKN